jgi:hypothetical protein
MAKRGRIGDYTRAKLDEIIDNKVVTGAGDITGVTAGDGLTGGGTSGDVTVAVDYAGGDSVVMAATDGTGITVATDDKLILKDESDGSDTVKYVNISQLPGSPGGSDTQVQYNNGGAFGGVASLTYNDSTGDLTVIDDKKLYFGTNTDGYIEYDENTSDYMIISGSSKGLILSGTTIFMTGGLEIEAVGGDDIKIYNPADTVGTDDYFSINVGAAGATTITTVDDFSDDADLTLVIDGDIIMKPQEKRVYIHDGTANIMEFKVDEPTFYIYDDANQADYFSIAVGTNGVTTIATVDADGDNADLTFSVQGDISLTPTGGDIYIPDDTKLHFGTNNDFSIEYDEDGEDQLIVTGSHRINMAAQSITASVARGFVIQGEPDGAGAKLFLYADQGDDTTDKAQISKGDSTGVLFFLNYGGFEFENPSTSGRSAVMVDNNDTDEYAIEVQASNITYDAVNITADAVTTAKGLSITASALTTGQAFHIDHNDTATAAVTPTSVWVDFDKSGVTGDGVTSAYTGFLLDMRDTATNHANATVTMTGLDIDVASVNAQGTLTNTGASITATGADTNIGLAITTTDGNPAGAQDIKIMSSADSGDFFSISTYTAGLTTFTTVDDGGAEADIVFAPDGVVRINDDINLAFGHTENAYIQYDETTSDKLIMSGAHGGTFFSGSSIHVGSLGAAGTTYGPSITTPVTAFDTITDLGVAGTDTCVDFIADGQGGGDMIRLGTFDSSVTTAGMVCNMYRHIWYAADRSDSTTAGDATRILGIALAADGAADEGLVLLRGFARIPSGLMNGYSSIHQVGDPIYLSTTAGEFDFAVSSTSGDVVRIVGYLIDTDGTDFLIYFNPDNTFVTIA